MATSLQVLKTFYNIYNIYACTMHKLTHVNMFHIGFRKVRKVGYAPMIGISGLTACIVYFGFITTTFSLMINYVII